MNTSCGTLWLVATPIGNLGDFSPRAVETLKRADLIAAEDTRHSQVLLRHFGIAKQCVAYHEHNEQACAAQLVERLRQGAHVALISDAGTPLVSDPGYRLVAAAHAAGVPVRSVPGPCALVAALGASGLPTDRFAFEGFLPAKAAARKNALEALRQEPRTMVFYEAKHRINDTLCDAQAAFGPDRAAALAHELTKVHESVHSGTLASLSAALAADPEPRRGEWVLVIAGHPGGGATVPLEEGQRIYALLRQELPPGRAAQLASRITGVARNLLYAERGEAAPE